MSPSILLVLIVALSVLAFQVGKARAISVVGGLRGVRELHSLPGHYGLLTAIWCGLPALLVFGVWIVLQDVVITRVVLANLPDAAQGLPAQQLSLLVAHPVSLVVHDNRSTMISFKRDGARWRLRLHHMFLRAPVTVVRALARYLQDRDAKASAVLERWLATCDHSVQPALEEWRALLLGPLSTVLATLEGDDERSQRLRQSSPFCGILSQAERTAIILSHAHDQRAA